MDKSEKRLNTAIALIVGVTMGLCLLLLIKVGVTYQPSEYDACVAYQERFIKAEYPDAKNDILRYKIDKRVKEFCSLN